MGIANNRQRDRHGEDTSLVHILVVEELMHRHFVMTAYGVYSTGEHLPEVFPMRPSCIVLEVGVCIGRGTLVLLFTILGG